MGRMVVDWGNCEQIEGWGGHDPGRELDNFEFKRLAQQYGFIVEGCAGGAHWQIDAVERVQQTARAIFETLQSEFPHKDIYLLLAKQPGVTTFNPALLELPLFIESTDIRFEFQALATIVLPPQ